MNQVIPISSDGYFAKAYLKLNESLNPRLSSFRRGKLKRTDFTIISNNCWAGSVYRYFGLPYQSPTAGLYFFADDYVKFCKRLRHYTSCPITFIKAEDSSHCDQLLSKAETKIPIGQIDDIEIVFLHYPTPEEAEAKWVRRCNRINWDNLLIKNSQMNGCTNELLSMFDEIPFSRKICFVAENSSTINCGIHFPGYEGKTNIDNDTTFFNCAIDIIDWINSDPEPYTLG